MAKRSNAILLISLGAGLAYLVARNRAAPVAGLGSNLNTAAFAAQARAITMAKQAAIKKAQKAIAKDPAALAKQSKWIQKVLKGKGAPPPPPGATIEYQDENGNVITKAEYDRRQAEYDAQSACYARGGSWAGGCVMPTSSPGAPQSMPGISQPSRPLSATEQAAVTAPSGPSAVQQAMAQSSGGGGGAEDYYQQPSAPSQQEAPAPTFADQPAQPAPAGKMNPLVAVAAFAAVPFVLALTGGK